MKKEKNQSIEAAELRRRAEVQLKAKTRDAGFPRTDDATQRLLHELQVHQIELEMQNAELRQARDEAETTMEKYADLYDFAPVAYFTLDREGIILAANLTGASLLGIEHSRLLGRRFAQFVAATDRPALTAFLGKFCTSQAKEMCEVTLLNGGNSPLFVQIEAVASASGQECRIALLDITGRKRMEESLRQAKREAEAAARSKSQFLVNMSHELRTPMTGILGMLQLSLEEDLAPVPREYLETTLTSARALLSVLNDILVMAKIEAGKLTIEEKPFSPQRCITEAVELITPEMRRKGLDLVMSVAEELPETVVGDQVRLRQVFTNLIGNAVKFTEGGTVEVRVTAGRSASDGKHWVTFAVTDTGIGIPDDKKELLFMAFSQVDASLSRRYGGTGLGLAISRELVELMGGTISFESEEGVGSTFSFTIPLGDAGLESGATADFRPTEATTPAPAGERIPRLLVAEDDPTNREVMGLMLKRSNYNIVFADDGQKAVEMWEKGEYDLVLMDVQMPRLNGFDATRAIREKELERGGHTPIVAITAHARKEDKESCLAAGMDAYVSKPIDFKKCLEVVRGLLSKQGR